MARGNPDAPIEAGQARAAVQACRACVAYADSLVGEVLAALERSPRRDDTIVVLWSDNGFHLGEKGQWGKRSERWRYTRYRDGAEELYDHAQDPREWKNLALEPGFEQIKRSLAAHLPRTARSSPDRADPR